MKFEIIVEPDEDSFWGHCPQLKGLHTCGDSLEEALKNVGDALSAYMASMIKHNEKLGKEVL